MCDFKQPSNITSEHLIRYSKWLKEAHLDSKDHQLEGMKWILFHELCKTPEYGIRGGIIADERGLGKTILMLGTVVSNFKRRTLIVVPPALLNQWKKVIGKFGVGLISYTIVYHGYQAKKTTEKELDEAHIVLTTYGMIAKKKKGSSPLTKILWDRIIYDEAHHMRTVKTAIYRGAMQLKSGINWLVTGTPIQNKVADVHSLCNIMGLSKAFEKHASEAKKILAYHLLRRTKEEVGIKLPEILVHNIDVDWASENEKSIASQIHSHISFSDVNSSNVDRIITYLNLCPLPMLTRARQTCILPALLQSALYKLKRKDMIPEDIHLRDIETASKQSSILKTLFERSHQQNLDKTVRRKLVFCHYREEIDAIGCALNKMGIRTAVIDGRTKKRHRQISLESAPTLGSMRTVCKKWNTDLSPDIWSVIDPYLAPEVMLLQIQTACEGLNLQHFQEIYFTSPHWNPAVEDQAIARAHRIGQERIVDVFHFVMKGFGNGTKSIDQYCQQVQDVKRDLAKQLLD